MRSSRLLFLTLRWPRSRPRPRKAGPGRGGAADAQARPRSTSCSSRTRGPGTPPWRRSWPRRSAHDVEGRGDERAWAAEAFAW